MENNNKLDNNNKDFIDRKVAWFTVLFDLMSRDWKNFIMTLSIISNIYLGHLLIKTNKEMSQQIIEEVRRQAVPAIRTETSRQLEPIKSKIDTTVNQINNLITQDNE